MMGKNLYETDYAQWTESQINALKARDWEKIDFEHLIENLEMGDPKETVESNLVILIAHLLKLTVQQDAPDWMTNIALRIRVRTFPSSETQSQLTFAFCLLTFAFRLSRSGIVGIILLMNIGHEFLKPNESITSKISVVSNSRL